MYSANEILKMYQEEKLNKTVLFNKNDIQLSTDNYGVLNVTVPTGYFNYDVDSSDLSTHAKAVKNKLLSDKRVNNSINRVDIVGLSKRKPCLKISYKNSTNFSTIISSR